MTADRPGPRRAAPIQQDDGFPPLLTSDGAIKFLASIGIMTSRDTLDRRRNLGKLGWKKGRGRHRVLYTKADLLDHFMIEDVAPCLSKLNETLPAEFSNVVALSSDDGYEQALRRATRR